MRYFLTFSICIILSVPVPAQQAEKIDYYQYDFVLQHPRFNADPYCKPGYWKSSPEPYELDPCSSNGKFLWRYDMGWSIETGTWYSPYMVFDVDGDGRAEVFTKKGDGDPRELDGHVMQGPEYLVKLDQMTGTMLRKQEWIPRDGYDSYKWWSRDFLSIAYLDGLHPSLIMQRGIYTLVYYNSPQVGFE